jgi:RNA polymerase sigma factor (sigma-70 family)
MDAQQWQAEQFERHRGHLHAVAYRVLGSPADADDAVQEAWLRLNRSDVAEVANLRAWLTTVVSRVCFDMLRARRSRHEQPVDGWELEPVLLSTDSDDPEEEVLLADSVGVALLVVLETLSPAERIAFVLHDMFGVPFEEIAQVVGREPAAARQLASRARRRVRGADTAARAQQLASQAEVVSAFLAASRDGDFEALVALLDSDVTFTADRAGVDDQPLEVVGREEVLPMLIARGSRFAHLGRPALVDGEPGVIVVSGGRVIAVLGFEVRDGRVRQLRLTRDPVKLRAVRV